MQCPSCHAELPEPFTRFCEGCGLANPHYKPPRARKADEPTKEIVRCPECGLPAESRRCRGCGAPVRWPEGINPPGE